MDHTLALVPWSAQAGTVADCSVVDWSCVAAVAAGIVAVGDTQDEQSYCSFQGVRLGFAVAEVVELHCMILAEVRMGQFGCT